MCKLTAAVLKNKKRRINNNRFFLLFLLLNSIQPPLIFSSSSSSSSSRPTAFSFLISFSLWTLPSFLPPQVAKWTKKERKKVRRKKRTSLLPPLRSVLIFLYSWLCRIEFAWPQILIKIAWDDYHNYE